MNKDNYFNKLFQFNKFFYHWLIRDFKWHKNVFILYKYKYVLKKPEHQINKFIKYKVFFLNKFIEVKWVIFHFKVVQCLYFKNCESTSLRMENLETQTEMWPHYYRVHIVYLCWGERMKCYPHQDLPLS